jgi:riboflavin transporter FmnP
MKNTRLLALLGIMSALSFILYLIEIPVGFLFPAAPFLQIDFSDLPAIFLGMAYGPAMGAIVALVKNVLHLLFKSSTPAASGEIANFFAGLAFLMPVSIFMMMRRKQGVQKLEVRQALIFFTLGIILTTLVMMFINYNITLPLYGINDSVAKWGFVNAITPFNIFKGILLTVISVLLYPRLTKFLAL